MHNGDQALLATSATVDEALSSLSAPERKELLAFPEKKRRWIFAEGGFTRETLLREACSKVLAAQQNRSSGKTDFVGDLRKAIYAIINETRETLWPRATEEEIRTAVQSLSPSEYRRVLGFAERHFDWLQDYGGSPPEELVTEAIQRTDDGIQIWRPTRRDFVRHLFNAIKSIATHNLDSNQKHQTYEDDPGDTGDAGPTPDSLQLAKKLVQSWEEGTTEAAWDGLDELKQLLALDREEENLTKDLLAGYRKTEIAQRLNRNNSWVTEKCNDLASRITRDPRFRETLADTPHLYQLASLLQKRRSNTEICKLLDCTKEKLKALKSELRIRFLAFLGTA